MLEETIDSSHDGRCGKGVQTKERGDGVVSPSRRGWAKLRAAGRVLMLVNHGRRSSVVQPSTFLRDGVDANQSPDGKNSAGSGRSRTVARTPRGGVVGRVLGLVLGERPHRRRRVLLLEARRLLVLVDEALDEAAKLVEE